MGTFSPDSNQPHPLTAPLLGRWQFQYREQRIYFGGELLEVIRQEPPFNGCRTLDATEQTLTWYHEYTDGSPTGAPGYTVTRHYTRVGDTLLIVPFPGIEPSPTTIFQLTNEQLVLLNVPTPELGFSYEWETGFSR